MPLPLLIAPIAGSLLKTFNLLFEFFKKYIIIIILGSYLAPFLLYPLYVLSYSLNSAIAVGAWPFITYSTASYMTGLVMFDIVFIFFLSVSKFFKS